MLERSLAAEVPIPWDLCITIAEEVQYDELVMHLRRDQLSHEMAAALEADPESIEKEVTSYRCPGCHSLLSLSLPLSTSTSTSTCLISFPSVCP